MRGLVAALCLCAACGRLSFDDVAATASDAPASDSAVVDTQVVDAMPCETDVVLRPILRVDGMQWVDLGNALGLAAILHIDNAHHEIHFYNLTVAGGSVVSSDVLVYATSDMYGLSVLSTPAGYAMAVSDLNDSQVHLFLLDAGDAVVANTALTGMGTTVTPLARSSAGVRVVGTTANGIGMEILDASNAPVGSPIDIVTAAAGEPSITSIGPDFIVGWDQLGDCMFERVDAGGAVLAGPLIVDPPATASCGLPFAVATGGGVVYTVLDRTNSQNPVAYAAAGDPSLAAATTPVAIGGTDSTTVGLIDTGTYALAAVRTSGDSRVVQVTPSGTTMAVGSDFGLAGVDTDTETLALVGTALIHARTESGMLQIRKLCR